MNQNAVQGRFCASNGFTLIELLIVVLIIGILAAVAVPQYQKAVLKSRMMQGIVFAKAIHDAQEAYFLANGEYADSQEKLDVNIECPADWICTVNTNKVEIRNPHTDYSADIEYSYDGREDKPNLAGALYCSARSTNAQAVAICKSMGPLLNDEGGWERYRIN